MFTAIIKSNYIPYINIAYPIEIENNGTSSVTITITSNNTVFTQDEIIVDAGSTKYVYASTHASNDIIVFTDNFSNIVNLNINTVAYTPPVEYGDPSYIAVFELPGGVGEVIPTLENIHLLMKQGHYFIEDGQIKIWQEDTL